MMNHWQKNMLPRQKTGILIWHNVRLNSLWMLNGGGLIRTRRNPGHSLMLSLSLNLQKLSTFSVALSSVWCVDHIHCFTFTLHLSFLHHHLGFWHLAPLPPISYPNSFPIFFYLFHKFISIMSNYKGHGCKIRIWIPFRVIRLIEYQTFQHRLILVGFTNLYEFHQLRQCYKV